ncbi:hypothetical protein GGI07_002158 [Coemansia sp. Benny D115]|nr:hypothetical protein GGI07_002158 [Coemansia sp. Benny D115]
MVNDPTFFAIIAIGATLMALGIILVIRRYRMIRQSSGPLDLGNPNTLQQPRTQRRTMQFRPSTRPVKPYNPFGKDELQLLPTIVLTQSNIDSINAVSTDSDKEGRKSLETEDGTLRYASPECSICLVSYKEEDVVRVLSCSHTYHSECIDVWLTERSARCPICKTDIRNALGLEPRRRPKRSSSNRTQSAIDSGPGSAGNEASLHHVVHIASPPRALLSPATLQT